MSWLLPHAAFHVTKVYQGKEDFPSPPAVQILLTVSSGTLYLVVLVEAFGQKAVKRYSSSQTLEKVPLAEHQAKPRHVRTRKAALCPKLYALSRQRTHRKKGSVAAILLPHSALHQGRQSCINGRFMNSSQGPFANPLLILNY